MRDLHTPSSEQTINQILQMQRTAFLQCQPVSIDKRKANLSKLKAAMLAKRARFKVAISDDFAHRSAHETDILEFFGIIQSIDYMIKHLPRFMKRERRHVGLFFRPGKAYIEYQPKGVIGIMAPWNYPLALTIIPLATALAAGNRAMIKPSELTPKTSALIKLLIEETFAPDEVAVVIGGAEVGAEFSQQPFDHLFFTGSTLVGKKIMAAASANLVPLTLELGGKSPAVIAKGHINKTTVKRLVFGKLANAGQTCVAPDYIMIHEQDLDSFITQFSDSVRQFYPTGPTSNDFTAIINDKHYERLMSLIANAKQAKANVIEVGLHPETASSRTRTIAPTLVINPADSCAIMEEEIFGPILPIKTYQTMQEAIDYINSRPRPLALYYFGDKDADGKKLLSNTTSGNVGVNNTLMHVAQDDLPFGGVGLSGMGAYHGIEGFRSMSHAKGFYEQSDWNFADLLRAPFGRFVDFALRFTLGKK